MPNILLEKSGEIAPEGMKAEPKRKQHPVVAKTGDGSKVRCCTEQYCIGTWNVRSMNSRQVGNGRKGDGKSEHRYFRNL